MSERLPTSAGDCIAEDCPFPQEESCPTDCARTQRIAFWLERLDDPTERVQEEAVFHLIPYARSEDDSVRSEVCTAFRELQEDCSQFVHEMIEHVLDEVDMPE